MNQLKYFLLFLLLIFLPYCKKADLKTQETNQKAYTQLFWGNATQKLTGTLLVAQRLKTVPSEIQNKFPNKFIRVFSIDLDSDGKKDFIVDEVGGLRAYSHAQESFPAKRTCFMNSSFKIKSCQNLNFWSDGREFIWFTQLNETPLLEFFILQDDVSDRQAVLYKLNAQTWTPEKITGINPVIISKAPNRKEVYWPRNPAMVQGLPLKKSGDTIKLKATLNHRICHPIDSEPDVCDPNEAWYPVIYFYGRPPDSSADRITTVENQETFFSLQELRKLSKQKKSQIKARCANKNTLSCKEFLDRAI